MDYVKRGDVIIPVKREDRMEMMRKMSGKELMERTKKLRDFYKEHPEIEKEDMLRFHGDKHQC